MITTLRPVRKQFKNTIHRHAGYEMRSHSETRWAAMMDVMGVTWLYEPQVIKTRHGGYMPDFFLPAAGMFIEVKGPAPTQIEREKALDAQEATGYPVVFAYGRPEMLSAELYHGMLSYYGYSGDVSFSTAEIGSLVRHFYDMHTYAGYMTAGEHKDRPTCFRMSDGIEEVINGWLSRDQREAKMRELHAPLNAAKSTENRQASRAEIAMADAASRITLAFNVRATA
jgi:hypothetical protein